jgi:hypothetical protein
LGRGSHRGDRRGLGPRRGQLGREMLLQGLSLGGGGRKLGIEEKTKGNGGVARICVEDGFEGVAKPEGSAVEVEGGAREVGEAAVSEGGS